MAYDPEARRQSNSAVIIGIVALVLIGGGALAYLASRPNPEPVATVVTTPGRETVVNNTVTVPVPVDSSPNIVVQQPPVVVTKPSTVTRVERNTTTVRERDRVVAPATSTPATGGGTSSNTNVTVNVPPADTAPAAPAAGSEPAGDAGTTTPDAAPPANNY